MCAWCKDIIAKIIKAIAEWIDRCLPEYNPGLWNDDYWVQRCNNCYNYACDIQTNDYAQPGLAHGITLSNGTCSEVTAGAIADGLASINCDESCGCDECRHKVALVIKPGTYWDYHWYRQDRDGKWSHKMATYPATNLDNSDNIITDPRTADRRHPTTGEDYSVFCGCFCVNKTQVTIQGYGCP